MAPADNVCVLHILAMLFFAKFDADPLYFIRNFECGQLQAYFWAVLLTIGNTLSTRGLRY